MHESIRLLNKALELTDQEFAALEEERELDLDALCQERVELVNRAWRRRESCDPQELKQKLMEVRDRHNSLMRRAEQVADGLRDQLAVRKQSSPAIAGYHRALVGVRGHQIFRRAG